MKLNHPKLTERKFTARNALFASRFPRGLAGSCTRSKPWGEQCGAELPDGTPVDRDAFVRAVLCKLAGEPEAVAECLARWHERIAEVNRKGSAANPIAVGTDTCTNRECDSGPESIKPARPKGHRVCLKCGATWKMAPEKKRGAA